MSEQHKHQQISEALLKAIAAGEFRPSGKLPSEAQLVKRFNASRPTVARALYALQEEGLIERRAGSGSYVVDSRIAAKSQRLLALLVPEMESTKIFQVICGEIARLARLHHYRLLWDESDSPIPISTGPCRSYDDAKKQCDYFIQQNVNGVFFAPFEHTRQDEFQNRQLADMLQRAGMSIVLLDRDLAPFPSRSEYDLVSVDNFSSGYAVASHVLKLGARRCCFLATQYLTPTVGARIAGAREAIIQHGLPITDNFVLRLNPNDAQALPLLRQMNVDAVLCANDFLAANLLERLLKANIRVPHDIRITGFDDVDFAERLPVPLTTVHQPCRSIALVAFRAMIDSIEAQEVPPRNFVLPGRLVVRESCGAYANGQA